MAQIERESRILEQRGPHVWTLRRAFEEGGSHAALKKYESGPRVLYLHGRGSRVLKQKHGPRVWALRHMFEEHRSRVASNKCGSKPRILYMQSRLQLQSLQFVIDRRDAFVDVQHSG